MEEVAESVTTNFPEDSICPAVMVNPWEEANPAAETPPVKVVVPKVPPEEVMVFTLRVDWTVALPVIWRSPPKTERPTTAKEESGEEEAIETVPVAEKEVAVEVAEIFRFL